MDISKGKANNILKLGYPSLLKASDWDNVWFDESRQRYVIAKNNEFYIWAPWFNNYAFPDPVLFYKLPSNFISASANDKALVNYAVLSLDSQLFAVQLSEKKLLVVDLYRTKHWIIEIKVPSENKIIYQGLLWSEHGGNSQDLIIVTKKGLELHKISTSRGQCKLSRTVTHKIHMYWYEPNHRMCLLVTANNIVTNRNPTTNELEIRLGAMQFNGYFLNVDNHDKENPSVVRLELLPPSKIPAFEIDGDFIRGGFENFYLVTLYGTVYFIVKEQEKKLQSDKSKHILKEPYNPGDDVLTCYAITKNSVISTHKCLLRCSTALGSKLRLSVVDNLLLCHVEDRCNVRKTIIFDIMLSTTSTTRVSKYKTASNDRSTTPSQPGPTYVEWVTPICPPIPSVFDISDAINTSSGSNSNMSSSVQDADVHIANITPNKTAIKTDKPTDSQLWDAIGNIATESLSSKSINMNVKDDLILEENAKKKPVLDGDSPLNSNSNYGNAGIDETNKLIMTASPSVKPVRRGSKSNVLDALVPKIYNDLGGVTKIHLDSDDEESREEMHHMACNTIADQSTDMSDLRFMPPNWVWDKKKKCQWQISINIKNLIKIVKGDPKNLLQLLFRRGQFVKAPRPVPIVNPDDYVISTKLAKSVLLSEIFNYMDVSRMGLSWLELIFDLMIRPYAAEAIRSIVFNGQDNVPNYSQHIASPPNLESKSNSSSANISSVADASSGGTISNSNVGGSSHHTRAPNPSKIQTYNGIEPNVALSLFLPEIHAIKCQLKSKNTANLKPSAVEVQLSLRRGVDGVLIISQTEMLSLVWLPLLSKSLSGLSECDNRTTREIVEYCSWSLSTYIAALSGHGLLVQPTLCLLLFNFLSSYQNYTEVCRLLQFQFFPDTVELAMTALELSESIRDEIKAKKEVDKKLDTDGRDIVYKESLINIFQQSGIDMLWRLGERSVAVRWLLSTGYISSAITCCMKKKGSWRNGLTPSCIPGIDFYNATLLHFNQEMEEISRMRKRKLIKKHEEMQKLEQLQEMQAAEMRAERIAMGLPPEEDIGTTTEECVDIPSNVHMVDIDERKMECTRVQVMHVLYNFLKQWDYNLVVINSVSICTHATYVCDGNVIFMNFIGFQQIQIVDYGFIS